MKKGLNIAIMIGLLSFNALASDNSVTMTDLKEATYKLVIESKKTNVTIEDMEARLKKVEPIPAVSAKNTTEISNIVTKLNSLGLQVSPESDQAINTDIENFVNLNRHLLPNNGGMK